MPRKKKTLKTSPVYHQDESTKIPPEPLLEPPPFDVPPAAYYHNTLSMAPSLNGSVRRLSFLPSYRSSSEEDYTSGPSVLGMY